MNQEKPPNNTQPRKKKNKLGVSCVSYAGRQVDRRRVIMYALIL